MEKSQQKDIKSIHAPDYLHPSNKLKTNTLIVISNPMPNLSDFFDTHSYSVLFVTLKLYV